AKDRQVLQCEQPYQKAPASVGIFATRSPLRPNPIALTIVPIINIAEDGKIYLPYIDAEDGSPIIDLKPYHPATDRVRDLEVPDWCRHWPQWYEDSASFDWEAELINAK
ncbi:MAG: TrmO family methyltransferase, partial [Halanaerobiales bacterium]|nr:TrmO family methyltransferase [Halanaerobiales bacterium]